MAHIDEKEKKMSKIKYSRSKDAAKRGEYNNSFDAMYREIPESVKAALTSKRIAELVDAMWNVAQKSKAIANREAIEIGAVWDEKAQKHRDIEDC